MKVTLKSLGLKIQQGLTENGIRMIGGHRSVTRYDILKHLVEYLEKKGIEVKK